MSIFSAVVLGIVVVSLLYFILIYNGLIRLRHNIDKAWSNIDVLLKQRHDEIPKLVQVCRQYQRFEQHTLVKIVEARARVYNAGEKHDVSALGRAETQLRSGLDRLFALAEAYPDLQANQHFLQLQIRITALENSIADRREWYNEAVNLYNIGIEQFPDLMVAMLFHFNRQALLRFSKAEKANVDMKELLAG